MLFLAQREPPVRPPPSIHNQLIIQGVVIMGCHAWRLAHQCCRQTSQNLGEEGMPNDDEHGGCVPRGLSDPGMGADGPAQSGES